MMHHTVLKIIVICMFFIKCIDSIAITQQPFTHFLHEYVDPVDWQDFKLYYENQLQIIHQSIVNNGGLCSTKDIDLLSSIVQQGESALKNKNSTQDISLVCNEHEIHEDRQGKRALCIRYGMYDNFLHQRAQKTATIMGRLSNYWGSLRYKMSCWVNSIRTMIRPV